MNNRPIYVYALINPLDNQVFYIGVTDQPKERLSVHHHDRSNVYKYSIVKNILSAGLRIEMEILEICHLDDSRFFEEFYIDLFRFYGFDIRQNGHSNYSVKTRIPRAVITEYTLNNRVRVRMNGIFMGFECEATVYYSIKPDSIDKWLAYDKLQQRYCDSVDFVLKNINSEYIRDGMDIINKKFVPKYKSRA